MGCSLKLFYFTRDARGEAITEPDSKKPWSGCRISIGQTVFLPDQT
jgi:hypothetical protein